MLTVKVAVQRHGVGDAICRDGGLCLSGKVVKACHGGWCREGMSRKGTKKKFRSSRAGASRSDGLCTATTTNSSFAALRLSGSDILPSSAWRLV